MFSFLFTSRALINFGMARPTAALTMIWTAVVLIETIRLFVNSLLVSSLYLLGIRSVGVRRGVFRSAVMFLVAEYIEGAGYGWRP